MPRKIKVVDVVSDNSNETVVDNTVQQLEPIPENNEKTDTVEATTNDEVQSTETKEEVKPTVEVDKPTEEVSEAVEELPKTKVRTNELHECPKCGKYVTLKSLKYTHQLTCGTEKPEKPKKEKPTPKPKGRPKKDNTPAEVQEVEVEEPAEKSKPLPVLTPQPIKSFEEMRRERLRERVQQRTQRISNLFLQAF
jgi:ssDNA-binding Zn-finger/Zn-ribbon topoisomerase 1